MLVKFWGINQGGGDGDGSVNYLLNERVKQGTAKVLKGDANLTKSLLLSLTQKHKACVGCLSFEESNIDESLKYELMESFENALLTESMQNRYNILWVEHTDKGRLELNFVIPRIDLERQKAFNPYYHKVDLKRIDTWKDCINLKHNFTNPKDLEKQHNIQQHQTKNPKNKELLATYEKLDKLIQDNLGKLFNSRADIINFLKDNQCEVTRQGKDYISVRLPNEPKAKRLKGFYYHETFRTIADIRDQLSEVRQRESQRERPNYQNNHAELLRELENKLHRHIEYKQRYYERLHQADLSNPRDLKEQPPRARESQQEIQGNYTRGFTRDKETNSQKFNREPNQENLDTNSNFYRGSSNHGSVNIALSQYYNATNQRPIRAFIQNEKIKTKNRGIRARKQSIQGILPTAQERELRESNAERTLKQATERFNQRNNEIENLQNDKNELLIKLEKVTAEFQKLRNDYLKLEAEILNLKESYETLSQTHNTLLAKFQALERAERAELNQLMQTLEQKEISLKNDLQSKCEQILQQELQNAQIKEQETSQAQYKELKTQLEILETTLKQELEQSYTTFMQEHEMQLTQLKTSTETQKNELETSFKDQMNNFQSEWNKKQENFIQKQHNWIERLENTIKK